jgi:hypothetical protein
LRFRPDTVGIGGPLLFRYPKILEHAGGAGFGLIFQFPWAWAAPQFLERAKGDV